MAETVGSDQQEFTIGRGGLKIPVYEWQDRAEGYQLLNFLNYFWDLWKLNGFDISTEFPYDGRRYNPRAFNHELVIPEEGDKPMTVLRGSYVPREKNDIEYEQRRDEEQSRHNYGQRNGVTVGYESHEILVPPDELGPFSKLLNIRYPLEVGNDRFGHSGVSVSWQGTYLSEHNFETPLSNEVADFDAWQKAQRAAVTAGLQAVLSEVVEVLS